jgi:sporulation delaying protein A
VRPRQVARILTGAIVCVACVAWLESPLRLSATRRLQMLAIAPQFWGYFSAPLQDRLEAFRWRDGSWVKADSPLGAAENLLGLRRGIVNHSAEFRTLVAQVGTQWTEATLTSEQLPETTAPGVAVRNLARRPQLCGEVLLLSRTPVPWAWARSRSKVALPARYAHLSVQC